MHLEKLLAIVAESSPNDWHRISCWGGGSGPSYKDRFQLEQATRPPHVTVKAFPDVAVYIPDASITIAWGFDYLEDFKEPWANSFPNSGASGSLVDAFYNNALVFRDRYVTVDGGRVKLPIPANDRVSVPKRKRDFVRLVHQLDNGSPSDFDRYFSDAGFAVTSEPWPTLRG